ncbi:hypothetical protein TNCV_2744231 [Trichonephila clavipes]|nr:hypothetical protein TNCV_2744231 [Trichonephila clavipes]
MSVDKNSAHKFKETFLQHVEKEGYSRDVYIVDETEIGKTLTESYAMLVRVYEDQALCLKRLCEWFNPFRKGRESVSDNHRRERQVTFVNDEDIEKVIID